MTQSRGNYNALTWLQDELQKSLAAALQSVQSYIDYPQQPEALSRCVEHLYQINGTLEMLNLHGAQQLAAEMQSVAGYLRSFPDDKHNEALEALTRSLLLLPTYLRKLSDSFPDHTLCLLDAINELRALREQQPIVDSDVFLPDLTQPLPADIAPSPNQPPSPLTLEKHKVAHAFQHLLLTWMREQDDNSLRKMRGVIRHLRLQCRHDKTVLFWWVCEALLETLAQRGLRSTSKATQLIGQMVAPIRLLSETDETALLASYPQTLLKQLLLLIARSSSHGPLVSSVKTHFDLTFYDQTAQLIGHSDSALNDAQAALLEQLEELKERISQFDAEQQQPDETVNDISLQLLSMADTLSLLQHHAQSETLRKQYTALQQCLAGEKVYQQQLTDLANDLLQIESQLRQTDAGDAANRQLQRAVLSECLNELNTVKEQLRLYAQQPVASWQSVHDELNNSLRMLAGSLDILNLYSVATLLSTLANKVDDTTSVFTGQQQQSLAEILAAIELYLEGMHQSGQTDEVILLTAEQTLQQFSEPDETAPITAAQTDTDVIKPSDITLQPGLPETSQLSTEPTTKPDTPAEQNFTTDSLTIPDYQSESADSTAIEITEVIADDDSTNLPPLEVIPYLHVDDLPSAADDSQTAAWQFAEGIEPEIAAVFVEEAKEVIAELQTLIPLWCETAEIATLTTIRRHFHTLKGSGRMANATTIADMAQAVEHLLNQVLDNSLELTDEIMALVDEALVVTDECLSRFSQGQSDFTQSAAALTILGRQLVTSSSDETETDEDSTLQHIFYLEAEQHLQTLSAEAASLRPGNIISKNMLNAAHSLKGCSNIAKVQSIALIASQLDQTFRNLYHQQQSFTDTSIGELSGIISEISQLLQSVQTRTEEPDIRLLDRRIFALCPHKAEQAATTPMEPEQLISFLEETDILLNDYTQQLHDWQQSNHEAVWPLRQTLSILAENAENAALPQLAMLYQLIQQLILHPQHHTASIATLLDQALEIVNEQIEALIQHKQPADFTAFREQIRDTLVDLDKTTGADIDPEILDTFTEEAAELLQSSNRAIRQWQETPDNPAAAMQLQRDFHTLKGGARLTANNAMADLTHQIETLLVFVTDQQQPPENAFFHLLQRCQDRLTEMQEQLARQHPIPPADDLLQEIEHYSGSLPEGFSDRAKPVAPPPTEQPTLSADHAIAEIMPVAEDTSHTVEKIRVRADLLDYLSNFAGEVSITRDQVTQQHGVMHLQLQEMEETVIRLQEQLRKLEIETETQILFRYEETAPGIDAEFDPLELDRFSTIQQLSRSLTETVNDLDNISRSMSNLMRETDVLLLQQSRLNTDLQQGLMHTRLLPFSSIIPRLERTVRQTNRALEKQSRLIIDGVDLELDRTIIDRLVAPLEHILRNAIAHGLETTEERARLGKEAEGQLHITLQREGSEVLISITDDGQGLNLDKIKQRAIAQNLIDPQHIPNEQALIQLILTSGFSTAEQLSQLAGRGVGMDVVSNEIRALKGRLSIKSQAGKGTQIHLRLPLTLSVMQALLITANQQQFAVPLSTVNAGERIAPEQLHELMAQEKHTYRFNNESYDFIPLGNLLGQPVNWQDNSRKKIPLLLFQSGEIKVALAVDSIDSNREIVIKSVGQQLGQINAINGATILGDGRVVFILDIPSLVENYRTTDSISGGQHAREKFQQAVSNRKPCALIVDDSITMRKATGNLLTRLGFDVMTAKDGVDALAHLYEQTPDIVLLDVEMPRMDGFEFASIIRNDAQFKHLPIVMITSRTGNKHRQRAMSIGVNAYLGKPYQDEELIASMKQQLGSRYPVEQHSSAITKGHYA